MGVACSPVPVVVGQTMSCTATVTDTAPSLSTPTGTVSFTSSGPGSFGSGGRCTLAGSGAAAGCAVSFTPSAAGRQVITAAYGGDLDHEARAGSTSPFVDQAGTTTSVTSSLNPSVAGQPVTFTAEVGVLAPGSGTPTGTVTFSDGGVPFGSAGLVGGLASFTTSTLTIGDHTITARYSGDQNFTASTGSLNGNPQRVIGAPQPVVGAPAAQINSPADDRTFKVGQHVPTSFSCTEAAGGPGIASCTDSNGVHAPAGALDTSKPGRFTYTVTAVSSDGLSASTSLTYTVLAVARVRIGGLHGSPLGRGCVVETGRDEREIRAISADATCRELRLALHGTIATAGKLASAAGGTITVSYRVMLPLGPAAGSARAKVNHGHWQISIVLPGVNLDPLPPSYLITVHYSGDHNIGPATAKQRIRLESERAGLNP